MQDLPKLPNPLLDDVRAVAVQIGASVPTVYRMMRDDPSFPRPRQIGRRMARWSRAEIESWVASRPAAR